MDGWVGRETDGRRYVPRAGDGRTADRWTNADGWKDEQMDGMNDR